MKMTLRWFGPPDPVPLAHIAQIPGVEGIVSALHEIPAGSVWPSEEIARRKAAIEEVGLRFAVVESLPVHEDIKLGLPERDRLIDQYCETVENIGAAGIGVLCYNFMPVFDWTRTRLDLPLPDGSTTLAFDPAELAGIDPRDFPSGMPAWAVSDGARTLPELLDAYRAVDAGMLWENLGYFLERVAPTAERAGVLLALHPDDPPWPIFGLPRIITDQEALERVVRLVASPANGITFCTGSLGALPSNPLPEMVRALGDRIHFAHCRNVRVTGPHRFQETRHLSSDGDVDMYQVVQALHDVGFHGPMRPDHGRMIWGETGRPGYGLHDRALGAMYLQGLWEATSRKKMSAI